MEYPYQLVTFFDRKPSDGEFVYQGDNGWYPQVALKRRFRFVGMSEDEGLSRIKEYVAATNAFAIRFGDRVQPDHMPVEVIEIIDSPAIMEFHTAFIDFMGESIESRFPERDGDNYYPHMTATWNGADVVATEAYAHQARTVTDVWVLKDDGHQGDSRAYRTFPLHQVSSGDAFTGVKAALYYQGKLLVYLRDDKPGLRFANQWDFFGGGREDDETPFQTLNRELDEELSITIDESQVVFSKLFPAMYDPTQDAFFMVVNLTDENYQKLQFGSEGQRCELMDIDTFMNKDDVVWFLKPRLQAYLDAESGKSIANNAP